MKMLVALVIAGGLAAATPALADCNYPKSPLEKIPSGSTAAKEDLIAARKMVQEYIATMDTYLACLDTELAASVAKPDVTEEQKTQLKTVMVQKSDAAQAEKEAVGLRMNEQLRAYNEKVKKAKEGG
jgi:hypothetical protein